MIGGHQFAAAKFEPLAAEMRDATIGFEKRLGGAGAETDDYFWRDGVELAEQERRAGLDFVGFRQAIFRRAAFYDVADVDVLALQAHGFDHLGQQFSGAAYERESLGIFVAARAFANEDQLGFWVAVTEDDFIARGVELAAGAFAEVFADFQEGVVGDFAYGVE
jgi:hypothetical protein